MKEEERRVKNLARRDSRTGRKGGVAGARDRILPRRLRQAGANAARQARNPHRLSRTKINKVDSLREYHAGLTDHCAGVSPRLLHSNLAHRASRSTRFGSTTTENALDFLAPSKWPRISSSPPTRKPPTRIALAATYLSSAATSIFTRKNPFSRRERTISNTQQRRRLAG